MTFLKAAPTVLCAALLSATFAPNVRADDWNKKTTITFSAPVEIPGVHLQGWGVLPAGTYVFKLLDSRSDRHIVQVFNADESIIYATILAIPNYRLKPTDKTVITFNEGIEGRPEAIRAWFYPGTNWGEEFVYPKAKALEMATITKTPGSVHAPGDPPGSGSAHSSGRAGGCSVTAGSGHGGQADGRSGRSRRSGRCHAARGAGRCAAPRRGARGTARHRRFPAPDRALRNAGARWRTGHPIREKSRRLSDS